MVTGYAPPTTREHEGPPKQIDGPVRFTKPQTKPPDPDRAKPPRSGLPACLRECVSIPGDPSVHLID
jgi:hypothetical protein